MGARGNLEKVNCANPDVRPALCRVEGPPSTGFKGQGQTSPAPPRAAVEFVPDFTFTGVAGLGRLGDAGVLLKAKKCLTSQ